MKFHLHKSWAKHLAQELDAPYMEDLSQFIDFEIKDGKTIFPKKEDIFRAFELTPFEKVKVVIIGQDPYHGDKQAHGLCFSVQREVKIPPSLVNIFKELKSDLNLNTPLHGNLESWAKKGVLLLNNVLTVEKSLAASHKNKGWEKFTDKVIEVLNSEKENIVFILWGLPAQKKAAQVDQSKHYVIKEVHPSPLSAYRGFFGSKPFSKTNVYLNSKGIEPINWELT